MTYWIWLLVILGGLALVPAFFVAAAIDVANGDSHRANVIGSILWALLVAGALAAMYLF